jgi:hypothetical protein
MLRAEHEQLNQTIVVLEQQQRRLKEERQRLKDEQRRLLGA